MSITVADYIDVTAKIAELGPFGLSPEQEATLFATVRFRAQTSSQKRGRERGIQGDSRYKSFIIRDYGSLGGSQSIQQLICLPYWVFCPLGRLRMAAGQAAVTLPRRGSGFPCLLRGRVGSDQNSSMAGRLWSAWFSPPETARWVTVWLAMQYFFR